MSIPNTNDLSLIGNNLTADSISVSYDAMTNVPTPDSSQASFVAGTGTPTFSAPKGTLYINLTGSSTSTRLYINTNGSTTWTNFTSAA